MPQQVECLVCTQEVSPLEYETYGIDANNEGLHCCSHAEVFQATCPWTFNCCELIYYPNEQYSGEEQYEINFS